MRMAAFARHRRHVPLPDGRDGSLPEMARWTIKSLSRGVRRRFKRLSESTASAPANMASESRHQGKRSCAP